MTFRSPIHLAALVAVLLWSACQSSETYTPRGFRYVLHTNEQGPKPNPGEYVYFDIVMQAGDSVFNTSYMMTERPRLRIPFDEELTRNTPPFIDGLKLMSIGDSLTLYFPSDSMAIRPVALEPYDMIEYHLKVVDIKTDEEFRLEMQRVIEEKEKRLQQVKSREPEIAEFSQEILAKYKAGTLENIISTSEGLRYVIHKEGSGRKPNPNEYVSVHYYGLLMNGLTFDNSFTDGEPYTFVLGQGRVITGWDIAIAKLNQGSRASLFIPPALGYGEAGYLDIPGQADLYFYVELEKIN